MKRGVQEEKNKERERRNEERNNRKNGKNKFGGYKKIKEMGRKLKVIEKKKINQKAISKEINKM